MPNTTTIKKIAKEKARLAGEIGGMYPRLTGQELMEIAVECNVSLPTLSRYRTDVKKIGVAERIVSAMNTKLVGREAGKQAA